MVAQLILAGLDLGQKDDYTALVVVDSGPTGATVILVDRFRKLPYPDAVDRVLARLEPHSDARLLVDCTGVGVAVGDVLRARGVRFTPVTIHGGTRIRRDADGTVRMPKSALFLPLSRLLGSRRLELPAGPLADELRDFGRRVDPRTGHERLEARRGHDDLVVALALACLPTAAQASPAGCSGSGMRRAVDTAGGSAHSSWSRRLQRGFLL